MGNCTQPLMENPDAFSYEHLKVIKIKKKDCTGNLCGFDKISVKLTEPVDRVSAMFSGGLYPINVSGCVLSGFDPRQCLSKECQDLFFISEFENSILIGLFDGHGNAGLDCARFCSTFMSLYYRSNASMFAKDPEKALESMFLECDVSLRRNERIDACTSGVAAILVYLEGLHITCASVGDSRAIIGSAFSERMLASRDNLRELIPVAISVDQKPNFVEEYERITRLGGIVKQLATDDGQNMGPFRVWKRNENAPGLAMSRSIGDSMASEIGVIATPIVHSFDIYPAIDQFIVIGSDGLWDTVNNEQTVNFVEKFRKKCKITNSQVIYPVRPENTNIAHYLAEEARSRWLELCEEDDIIVDDISVVVIELNSGPTVRPRGNPPERKVRELI